MIISINREMHIDIYSHFFKITKASPRIIGIILKFTSKYVMMTYIREKGRKPILKPYKIFAARVRGNKEFRYHIGQFKPFIDFLESNFITKDMYTVEYKELYEPVQIIVNLLDKWILRDYQDNIQDFIIRHELNDNRSRLVALETGAGKSLTSLATISKIKTRTAIIILPAYIEKWSYDVINYLDTNPKKIVQIQGSPQLKGLIDLAKENKLDYDFIIISLRTIQNFYKDYEDNKDMEEEGYGCNPEDFCKLLSIGTIIVDEAHQHLHAIFKLLIYTHVPRVIALTATMISDNPMISKMQHIMFPKEIRINNLVKKKYKKVYAITYDFIPEHIKRIKTTEYGNTNYSHNAFEKSIIRSASILNNYLKLIYGILKVAYLDDYIVNDKMIIYASSIDMCTRITTYLQRFLPDKDIRRYVESDPYENIINGEIIISTILSAGTAFDIPNLRVILMTTNIQSPVSNLQTLGRLRELKDRDVKFYYIWSPSIKKQVDYHYKKKELFANEAICHKDFKVSMMV
jgi:superfamily II DNA or RNA helicase